MGGGGGGAGDDTGAALITSRRVTRRHAAAHVPPLRYLLTPATRPFTLILLQICAYSGNILGCALMLAIFTNTGLLPQLSKGAEAMALYKTAAPFKEVGAGQSVVLCCAVLWAEPSAVALRCGWTVPFVTVTA